MRYIAFDIGFSHLGVAITEELNYLYSDTISASENTPFKTLFMYIKKLITDYEPQIAIFESVVYHKNAKTSILLGQVLGVIKLALELNNIKYVEIHPNKLKLAITGYGKSDKKQVQYMVQQIFKLPKRLNTHESDALALIWCYWNEMNRIKPYENRTTL